MVTGTEILVPPPQDLLGVSYCKCLWKWPVCDKVKLGGKGIRNEESQRGATERAAATG
jgi:hypothetical protein